VCFCNFFQPSCFDIVNKTPHRNMPRYPGMRSYLLDLLAHVVFKVTESMEGSGCHGRRSSLLLKFRAQVLILKRQHAAVGVIDDDEFLRAEKLVTNDESLHPAPEIHL